MKLIYTHTNPQLDEFETLQAVKPAEYAGFIYLWKCIPEDMFYLGSHKGPYHDNYRGSGTRFRKVFEHYGITQFKRVILEFVNDETKIKDREQYWMDKLGVQRSNRFYNLIKARK